MHAIAWPLTSTRATSLMHVKSSTYHFCLWKLFAWYIGTKKIKERTKISSFPLTLVNLSLAWMLYMYDITIRKYNQFGIYQPSRVSLLKPRQNNLSDPEAYWELGQIYKMDCFVKIVNSLNMLTFLWYIQS